MLDATLDRVRSLGHAGCQPRHVCVASTLPSASAGPPLNQVHGSMLQAPFEAIRVPCC